MYSVQSLTSASRARTKKWKKLRNTTIYLCFLGGIALNLYLGLHLGRDDLKSVSQQKEQGTPGQHGVIAPGQHGVIAPGQHEGIAPGQHGVIAPGQHGVIAPGQHEGIAPGQHGVIAPGQHGVIAPGQHEGIAWLMSFPNSGTTYVINFIQKGAKKRMGTNYLIEAIKVGKVPIYEEQPEGPFWITHYQPIPGPGEYVLTKTHCGGYIIPKERNMDRTANGRFVWECAMADIKHDISTAYPLKHVKKAVHIIRDPFDNVVARFHNHFKDQKKVVENKFDIDEYKKGKKGFRKFCASIDKAFQATKKEYLNEHQITLMEDIPCSGEFILYVLWHNNAFKATKMLNLDVMILHYDSFETNFEETSDKLLDFLGYPKDIEKLKFVAGKTYDKFFGPKQRAAVKEVLQELATKETWNEIKGYFLSDERLTE